MGIGRYTIVNPLPEMDSRATAMYKYRGISVLVATFEMLQAPRTKLSERLTGSSLKPTISAVSHGY